MVLPSRTVIGRGPNAGSCAGILTWASATEASSSHNVPNQSCRDIMSSVADGDLARLPQRPKRNPVLRSSGASLGVVRRENLLEGLIVLVASLLKLRGTGDTKPQSHLSAALPEEGSQFFYPSDLGSDRFLGDCLSSKAIISRPEAGTPTLPPRTISLALSARP
jgi:hypothetical protein